MKKESKEKIIKKEKIPYNPKDFVPNNLIDKLITHSPIYFPQEFLSEKNNYEPIFLPNEIPEEWNYNSEEEINEEIFSVHDNLFFDEEHEKIISNTPLHLIQINNNLIEWDRPSSYIPNFYIDKEIKRLYPKKNYISMRENIKVSYIKFKRTQNKENNDSDSELNDYLNNGEDAMKNAIYKDFYVYLEKKYQLKVVNNEIRFETDEEYELRKLNEEKKEMNKSKKSFKTIKNKKQEDLVNNIEQNKELINLIKPSDLTMNEFLNNQLLQNSYYTWFTSIFQMILDNNITDVETGKSIFLNIYPQKNNIPIYNPNGKYIIKLYLMGKPRKIIIDDRIPCNRNHEYILPQCHSIEEIWPALFIKALIKLNMYKARHPFYFCNEEFVDNSLIYELTGMHSIILDMNKSLINVFKKHFIIESEKKENDFSENNTEKENKDINKEKDKTIMKKLQEFKGKTDELDELSPIINYPLTEKYYFAVFNYKKNKSNNINENISYYDIIELIDKQNQRNGTYINQQNISWKNEINKKNEVKKLSSKLLNQVEEKSENNILNSSNDNISNKNTNYSRKYRKWPTIINKKMDNLKIGTYKKKEQLISSEKLVSNFLYSICDFFSNEKFNMKRLKFLDFSDLQKEISEKKVQFKQLAPNEKREYLLFRQKLKKEKIEEKNRRLRELKEDGIKYNLIKLINKSIQIHNGNFFEEYTEEEINLAKKCLLNNWNYPPPETFEIEFKKKEEEQNQLREIISKIDEDSRYRHQIEKLEGIARLPSISYKNKINKNRPIGLFAWTKEIYIEFIGNDLNQFEERNDNPKINISDGCWITFDDLINNFNKLLIVQNPNKIYHDKIFIDNSWNYFQTDYFEPLIDYNLFLLTPNSLMNDNQDKYSLIIIFEPYTEKFKLNSKIKNVIFPYISFDLVDKSNKCIIQNNIILNKFYSVYTFSELEKDNEYFIKINGGEYPTGYILQIMTEGHKIQNMSFNTYISEYENFLVYENQVYIPSIEKNKYYQIAKFIINNEEKINNEYIQFRISVDYDMKYIKQYILIFLEDENLEKKRLELDKIIKINKKYFSNNKAKTLIFSIKPEENLKESVLSIKIYYNEMNLKFDYVEEIEPFEIHGKYHSNKKGLIFSYFLYPSEKLSSTININFYHLIDEIKENNSKKTDNLNIYIKSKPLEKQLRIILELYKLTKEPSLDYCDNSIKFSYSNEGKLIKKWDFYNEIVIPDLVLYGDLINQDKTKKNEKKELKEEINIYLLLCYFDISEIDTELLTNESNDLAYTIRVFSSNNIGFINDTSKKEHEKLIKEEWENNDSGRVLRASRSRKRYLLFQKKMNNKSLNDDELKELNEKRERRSAEEIDHIEDNDTNNFNNEKKNNDGLRKSKYNISKRNLFKIEEKNKSNVEDNYYSHPLFHHLLEQKSLSMKNIFKKEKPKCNNSHSKFIINYVNYSKSNRTIFSNLTPEYSHNNNVIMNDEKMEQKKKNIIEYFEKSKETYQRQLGKFDKTFSELNNVKNLNKSTSMIRLSRMKKENKLLSQRNSIKDFIKNALDIKVKIYEIMNDTQSSDFEELINVYKESLKILGRKNENVEKFFDFISKKKEEYYKQELKKIKENDKSFIVKVLEDVEYNKWNISIDLIKKLKEMIKEV